MDYDSPDEGNTPLTFEGAIDAFEALESVKDTTPAEKSRPAPRKEPTPEATAEEPDEEEEQPDGEEPEESDEDEQPDDDGESDEDDEEQEEEEDSEPALYRVKVNGEEVEVTEDELLSGYSRTQDYTRKTMALAEERKAFQQETADVQAEREYYAQTVSQLRQVLEQSAVEPDWDALRHDPVAFAATHAAWEQHKSKIAVVRQEEERAAHAVMQQQQARYVEHLEAEKAKLIEAIPAWQDAETAAKEKRELIDFAKGAGYNDDELAMVSDHRVLLLLRKAMLYDKSQKKRPEAQRKIQKVKAATPSGGKSRAPNKATRARSRLAQSGRVDDAASLLEMLDE